MSAPALARVWPGETIVCLAGGASLTQADVDFCRGRARVIAINDAYRLAPWADVFYACDTKWWAVHGAQVMPLAGLKLTYSEEAAERFGIARVPGRRAPGLSLDPSHIHLGNNGGYQALNIATLRGGAGAKVILLGYDMQGAHWFGNHPKACRSATNFPLWIKNFGTTPPDLARAGVEVINCSRRTALDCFPRATLEEAFSDAPRLPVSRDRAC